MNESVRAPGDVTVEGLVAPGYEQVRDAFVGNFTRLGERGAAVAVYHDGRKVVDLWGGTRDGDGGTGDGAAGEGGAGAGPGGEPWRRGTAQIVRSATKGVAATVLLLLHQRGSLDLEAPVATYWPEYKAHGKDATRVRHLLGHRAGVPALDTPLTPEAARDLDRAAAAVAAQAPFWEPGTDHGYHAQTYGFLTGELVRRLTGRTLGSWVAEHLERPLGLDLWIGLPEDEEWRVGRITPLAPPPAANGLRLRPRRDIAAAYADPHSLTSRAFAAVSPEADENTRAHRAAELPAANGIATARGLARFYAALIGDVDGGRRLLTPATLAMARTQESEGPDRVLVARTRFGAGFMLHGPASPLLAEGSFGHPGRGGSLGFADPESGIGFGYVTNGLRKGVTADPRAQALVRAVRGVVGG